MATLYHITSGVEYIVHRFRATQSKDLFDVWFAFEQTDFVWDLLTKPDFRRAQVFHFHQSPDIDCYIRFIGFKASSQERNIAGKVRTICHGLAEKINNLDVIKAITGKET